MIRGERLTVCRRMWRRWWSGLNVDTREMVCAELCVLPRGTASDDGWLRRPRRAVAAIADAAFDVLPSALMFAVLCAPAPFVVHFA